MTDVYKSLRRCDFYYLEYKLLDKLMTDDEVFEYVLNLIEFHPLESWREDIWLDYKTLCKRTIYAEARRRHHFMLTSNRRQEMRSK